MSAIVKTSKAGVCEPEDHAGAVVARRRLVAEVGRRQPPLARAGEGVVEIGARLRGDQRVVHDVVEVAEVHVRPALEHRADVDHLRGLGREHVPAVAGDRQVVDVLRPHDRAEVHRVLAAIAGDVVDLHRLVAARPEVAVLAGDEDRPGHPARRRIDHVHGVQRLADERGAAAALEGLDVLGVGGIADVDDGHAARVVGGVVAGRPEHRAGPAT